MNKKTSFKFENMWMSHEEFKDMITDWWKIKIEGTTMYKLAKKLDELKRNIKIWNMKIFKNVHFRKIQMKKLEEIENEIITRGRMVKIEKEEKIVLVEYYNTILQEKQLWR